MLVQTHDEGKVKVQSARSSLSTEQRRENKHYAVKWNASRTSDFHPNNSNSIEHKFSNNLI